MQRAAACAVCSTVHQDWDSLINVRAGDLPDTVECIHHKVTTLTRPSLAAHSHCQQASPCQSDSHPDCTLPAAVVYSAVGQSAAAVRMQGFVPIQQAPSMFLCSSFSIAAGGSLGPEAPLLGGCGFRLTVFACQHLAVCSRVKTHTPAEHALSIHACPAALCAASTSWLGRAVLGYDGARLRNCALIGMAAGLAAFFGVSLGGGI